MKTPHWFFLVLIVVLLGILTFKGQKSFEYAFSEEARLGQAHLKVAIIQKEEDLVRGLSNHKEIRENEGLLFVFNTPDRYGIWMKDMNFALDIIWLDESKEIVSIRENFSPETYPEVAYPDAKSAFVLEVHSGFVNSNKIRVGDRLEIDQDTPQNPLVKPL